ncbi:putative HTH-type transcriptional regulator YhgD [Paenibacillus montaniterrae]|uniref:HTH-type transcriptional regulator YhgD n=1 Tax=Paenibacillus montaniterrae TaxID=429341 RepID=A0A919YQ48_9BACL|nr:TetR/AcrR family transcriptional regulator [Paenibacillus montaniterrae]GIP17983.1 putative HTH-type transcriptional regulator YhgD [Paenibacillus montaniterrae]
MSVDRRALIVEAANKSFALFGYKGTTMDQVAKIANVGKGTIYTFFTNKEELFQEVLNQLLSEMKYATNQVLSKKLAFFDALSEALNILLEFRKEHELALKLTQEVREIGTPMAVEATQQIERLIIEHIAGKVEQAIERKEIKPCDPELTAFIILRLYMALAVEWSKNHQSLDKSEVARQLRFYLENGLALK